MEHRTETEAADSSTRSCRQIQWGFTAQNPQRTTDEQVVCRHCWHTVTMPKNAGDPRCSRCGHRLIRQPSNAPRSGHAHRMQSFESHPDWRRP